MNKLNLFKRIGLNFKVKHKFNSFFVRENKKINTTMYMLEPTDNIKKIFNQIYNISKYEKSIILYSEYNSNYINHNNLLDKIYDKASKFHFENILLNPLEINYQELVDSNLDVISLLSNFKCTDKFLDDFYKDYIDFKDNYDEIKNQFIIKEKINKMFSNLDDCYIDNDEANKYKKIIYDAKAYYSSCNNKYYKMLIPHLYEVIEKHNEEFINNHIDDRVFEDVNGKSLDDDQRRAVLINSKSNLTIAGAGSGKTLTICGKVKYLLERMDVDKKDILLLSYSNKSASDLSNKMNLIAPDIDVYTFHALGLEILNKHKGVKNTIDESFNAVVEKYFREYVKSNPKMLRKIFEYYSLYLTNYKSNEKYSSTGEHYESLKKSNFVTLKNQLQSYKQSCDKKETIKKELVKSNEELIIANYLFINGIDYEYEATYKHANTANSEKRQYTPDFYFPKYNVYYEHYGIDENGLANQYNEPEASEYINGIQWKRKLHNMNETKCIETYSYEVKNGTIFDKLDERLKKHGIEKKQISDEKMRESLDSIYFGQQFKSLINLIRSFISLYKSKYSDDSYFDELYDSIAEPFERKRASLFLSICKDIYQYYMKHLIEENKIDFDDMVLKTINIIPRMNEYKYKYIIVDEFQDISFSRMRFLRALINHGNSKLFAVGDDWQAIYRFSGCDLNIFLRFEDYFDDCKKCFIKTTRRYSQELQNIASRFITKNKEQIAKTVISSKHLDNSIKIVYHDDEKYKALFDALSDIGKKDSKANVLLLGRNKKDIEGVLSDRFYRKSKDDDKYISLDFPNMNIRYITTHASKGLEEDYVIIINASDDRLGFPNKVEDDTLLDLVLSSPSRYMYAEERRLWYVALTRTKSYVYILVDAKRPSMFVEEIKHSSYIMNDVYSKPKTVILCPSCKTGKLELKESSRDNRKFYSCSNYPYCKYTNNDIKQVQSNHRCVYCGDFMTYRKGKYGAFWGCNNYPKCTYTEKYEHKK